MGVKGSWSRVKDRDRYAANLAAIQARSKKERLARALEVTAGKVVKPSRGK